MDGWLRLSARNRRRPNCYSEWPKTNVRSSRRAPSAEDGNPRDRCTYATWPRPAFATQAQPVCARLRAVEMLTQLELVERFVRPWYLKMMRLNACEYGQALATEISRAGRQADDDTLVRLLRLGWRERVMGAWMAVTRDSERVTTEVLTQLESSHGSLDSPPLVTASVVLAGPMSMPALVKYHEADTASAWGAAGVVQQAALYVAERFAAANPLPVPPEGKHHVFDALVAVANAIREGC